MHQIMIEETLPIKAVGVEFSVKNEPWVKYRLDDNTMLFGKLVITKVYATGEYDDIGQPVYGWSAQNLFTTISPNGVRGTPSNPPPATLDPKQYQNFPIDFERGGAEQGNVYEISGGIVLRIKLERTNIPKKE